MREYFRLEAPPAQSLSGGRVYTRIVCIEPTEEQIAAVKRKFALDYCVEIDSIKVTKEAE